MSLTFVLFEVWSCFAMAILMSSVLSLGLPPVLPLVRAASRPALVRSEIRLCSNSESLAISWKNSMPVGVLVFTSSVSDTTWMLRFFNFSSVSMSCCNDRPSRSSFHTTRVSHRSDTPWPREMPCGQSGSRSAYR